MSGKILGALAKQQSNNYNRFSKCLYGKTAFKKIGLKCPKTVKRIARCLLSDPEFGISSHVLCGHQFIGSDLLLENLQKAGLSSLWIQKKYGACKYNSTDKLYSRDGLFQKFGSKPWQHESAVKLIDVITTKSMKSQFLPRILYGLAEKSFPIVCGRVPHYIIIPGFEFKCLTAPTDVHKVLKNKTPYRCFLFSMITETKVLMQIPLDAFTGFRIKKIYKDYIKIDIDYDHMFLVKILPRADLYTSICEAQDLMVMVNALKHIYRSTSPSLIPSMERLLPDIGPTLINVGYSMNDHIRNLDFFNFHHFFKIVQTHPGFMNSPLNSKLSEKNIKAFL